MKIPITPTIIIDPLNFNISYVSNYTTGSASTIVTIMRPKIFQDLDINTYFKFLTFRSNPCYICNSSHILKKYTKNTFLCYNCKAVYSLPSHLFARIIEIIPTIGI